MNKPFLQIIQRFALNLSPEAIAAHQAKHSPITNEPINWPKNGLTSAIIFSSPPCASFSGEPALRRLAAKYGANHIQNVCAKAQETSG